MAKKITSVNNSLIIEYSKLINSKNRKKTGFFMVEGEKALEDILAANIEIENIFVTENYTKSENLPQDKIIVATEPIMKKLATSDSIPKIITVACQKEQSVKDFLTASKIVLADGISDPGNMGTIIRCAVAFGYDGILLSGNCTDIYNPKIIRSAAGNFFKIPFFKVDYASLQKDFSDFRFIMTDLHSDNIKEPKDIVLPPKHILVLGSEADGICQNVLDIPHENVKIPTNNVESLNVAISSAILMYEFSKKQ